MSEQKITLDQLVDKVYKAERKWKLTNNDNEPLIREIYIGTRTFANIMANRNIRHYYNDRNTVSPKFMGLKIYRVSIMDHLRIVIQ